MNRIVPLATVPLLAAALLAGCGYHVGGHADLIPKTVKTIAIPAFGNGSVRYQVASLLAADVTRELHARTHYAIVTDPAQADAVLIGSVVNFATLGGTTTDVVTGRATGAQIILTLQLNLTDRHTGKVLFSRTGYEFRERYEIATDLKAYFDESGTALKRVSRDAARSVVTAILEAC
jgi:outer membrane lipopolysaccharide assembly protein LptE/RlpB